MNRDYKTRDRLARKRLEQHSERMKELIAQGVGRAEASKQAFDEMSGNGSATTGRTKTMTYTKYKIRTCKSLHFCAICEGRIEYGQQYYDGGYGKRAHDLCADADALEKQATTEMAQANVEFYQTESDSQSEVQEGL